MILIGFKQEMELDSPEPELIGNLLITTLFMLMERVLFGYQNEILIMDIF